MRSDSIEELRIGVIGAGSIGRRHAGNLKMLGVAGVLVTDPDAEALARAADLGVKTEVSMDAFFASELDAIWVCSPPHLHVEHSRRALKSGCDLFIEKPISHTFEGISDLMRIAEERGRVTMVACNMRFHPGPARIKALIEDGSLGRIISARLQTGSFLPRWRPWQDYRNSYTASKEHGGAILDCIHEIDLALWYFGPARLRAAARAPATTLGLETEGLAELLLEHASGILSRVHLNFLQRNYRRICEVICENGTLFWDFGTGEVVRFDEEGAPGQSFPAPPGYEINAMYVDEARHFLNAVVSREASCNPLAGGLAALEIGLAARTFS